jgi:hypothetical protein
MALTGQMGSNPENKQYYSTASAVRGDQSQAERTEQMEGNYMYGGYAGGMADAQGNVRTNMADYAPAAMGSSNALSGYGGTFMATAGDAAGREAPIADPYVASDQFGQQGLYGAAGQMVGMAQQGPGPSQAQAQLNANTAMAMRQQLALAGSGRGAGGGASAFRQAGMNQAMIQGAGNAQAGVLQAQEEAAWRQQQAALLQGAGNMYATGRQGDMAAAGYLTGANQQQTAMNDQYALGMGGLASDAQLNSGNLALGAGEMQLGQEGMIHNITMGGLSGTTGYEEGLQNLYGINKGVSGQKYAADSAAASAREGAIIGGISSGIGMAAASDERVKTNIEEAPGAGLEMLDHVGGRFYDYTEPEKFGEGRYYGPMAQELEKSKAGKSAIIERDGVKMVDTGRLALANTSAMAELNAKLDKLVAEVRGKAKR